MQNGKENGREFTDEQLRAALKEVGRDARQALFAAGRPVVVFRNKSLIAVYADGREEVIETPVQEFDAGAGR